MKNVLYIIGNGFNLHHGLKTSYADFREDKVKKTPYLMKGLVQLYGKNNMYNDMWWNDFESMLGSIDYNCLENTHNGKTLGESKVKSLLKNNLPILFGEWIDNVCIKTTEDKNLDIDPRATFFNFNYTLTLENVYHVSSENIWHIHRSVRDVEKGEYPIVGHSYNQRELFQKSLQYRNTHPCVNNAFLDDVTATLGLCSKGVEKRIETNDDGFGQYSQIDKYIIMGFSFNKFDMPYIKKIIAVNSNRDQATWEVYVHDPQDRDSFIKALESCGVKITSVQIQEW